MLDVDETNFVFEFTHYYDNRASVDVLLERDALTFAIKNVNMNIYVGMNMHNLTSTDQFFRDDPDCDDVVWKS